MWHIHRNRIHLAYLIGCGAKVEEVQVEMDERYVWYKLSQFVEFHQIYGDSCNEYYRIAMGS